MGSLFETRLGFYPSAAERHDTTSPVWKCHVAPTVALLRSHRQITHCQEAIREKCRAWTNKTIPNICIWNSRRSCGRRDKRATPVAANASWQVQGESVMVPPSKSHRPVWRHRALGQLSGWPLPGSTPPGADAITTFMTRSIFTDKVALIDSATTADRRRNYARFSCNLSKTSDTLCFCMVRVAEIKFHLKWRGELVCPVRLSCHCVFKKKKILEAEKEGHSFVKVCIPSKI